MFKFGRDNSDKDFRLVITRNSGGSSEQILSASSEREAFEAASRLSRRVLGDALTGGAAFILDEKRVFLGAIRGHETVQHSSE